MKLVKASRAVQSGMATILTSISHSTGRLVAAALCGFAVSAAHAVPGQPGTLDARWAAASPLGAGVVMTPVGTDNDSAGAIVLQPDGKVLLAGYCYDGTNYDFCSIRYRANGTLDTSWGSAGTGKVITPVGGSDDFAQAITLQTDGKVLIAGECYDAIGLRKMCTLRYLANGTLDTTWGGAGTGIVVTSVGSVGSDTAHAVVVQPDGKVLVAGYCDNSGNANFCAVRYLGNGTLDTSWNGTGKVVTSISAGANDDRAYAMALQADGKVLLAGECDNGVHQEFCAVRYLTNGTLDTGWNGTGKVVTSIDSNDDEAKAIAVQPDGKVLLAGYCSNGTDRDFCSARYQTDGTLDTAWGVAGTGKVMIGVGSDDDFSYAIIVQPDGKVLQAGYCDGFSNVDLCSVRFHADGTFDASWGGGGKVLTAVGSGFDGSYAMALQPDGKLLLAGSCNDISGGNDFCAVRYDGGPFGYKACTLDLDGDNAVRATTDLLMGTRVALGMTGAAVVNGITFAAHASRDSWPLIRDYLITQCGMSLQ